jgi:hypothetical protein
MSYDMLASYAMRVHTNADVLHVMAGIFAIPHFDGCTLIPLTFTSTVTSISLFNHFQEHEQLCPMPHAT